MEPVPVVSNDIYFISLALFGTLWAMTALPFAHYVIRALRAGNLWLPFERKPNSRYTFMAQNSRFALFRAPRPENRTTSGLVVRYGIWLWVVLALAYVPSLNLIHILTH